MDTTYASLSSHRPHIDESLLRRDVAAHAEADLGLDPQPAALAAELDAPALLAAIDLLRTTLERLRHGDAAAWQAIASAGTPSQARQPAAGPPIASLGLLSRREHEVLQHLAAGKSNKEIARSLSLSPHTVKRHVTHILDKLGVKSRHFAAACLRYPH